MKKSTFDSEKSAWKTSENPRKNSLGYTDLTPFEAFNNMEKDDEIRFKKLLGTIFYICELAEFKIEERIVPLTKRAERLGGEKIR